jgi:hypothetical protein
MSRMTVLFKARGRAFVVQQARVEDEAPLAGGFRVTLAGPTLPVGGLSVGASSPQRVHVHDGEGAVTLLGDHDPDGAPIVVHELVAAEEVLPTRFPSPAIEASLREHPRDRIVGPSVRRPGPDHVGMEELHESLRVLTVPRRGLAIDHRLDFGFGAHAVPSARRPSLITRPSRRAPPRCAGPGSARSPRPARTGRRRPAGS